MTIIVTSSVRLRNASLFGTRIRTRMSLCLSLPFPPQGPLTSMKNALSVEGFVSHDRGCMPIVKAVVSTAQGECNKACNDGHAYDAFRSLRYRGSHGDIDRCLSTGQT